MNHDHIIEMLGKSSTSEIMRVFYRELYYKGLYGISSSYIASNDVCFKTSIQPQSLSNSLSVGLRNFIRMWELQIAQLVILISILMVIFSLGLNCFAMESRLMDI